MTAPTTEQVMALEDAIDAVHAAGWSCAEIDDHVTVHLKELYDALEASLADLEDS